jgi:DNA-binding protein H-NS
LNRGVKIELQEKIAEEYMNIEKYIKSRAANAIQQLEETYGRIADYRKQLKNINQN